MGEESICEILSAIGTRENEDRKCHNRNVVNFLKGERWVILERLWRFSDIPVKKKCRRGMGGIPVIHSGYFAELMCSLGRE